MNKCDSVDWCIKLTCRNIISNVSRTIEIIVYPVLASPTTQHEDILIHRRGILRNLMQFEVFRLLSFGPINDAVIVDSNFSAIQFAQEGFYDASGLGHYCCFSCNYTFTDVSANRHHHVNCRHLVDSVSIRDRGHLLTSNMFTLFNSIFSNPSNQPFVSEDDHDIHPQRGRDNLNAVNHLLPRNETLPVYAFPEIYIDENDGINVSENQFGNSFAISNSQEREDHSVQVSANRLMLNGAPQGVALSSENTVTQLQHSLPTYVNEVSGSVGIQESDAADSVVLLTSLSIKPVPFTHTPSQAAIISKTTAEKTMNAQNPPEEGAVGGHTTSFELSGASYPQFASSSARRATFTGWNPDHPQRPDDLVAGGFFYAGYADYVKCFYCGLGLRCWTPSDIPAYRHASFRPNCSYNRTINGQEAQRGGDSGTPNNTSISRIESARTETDTSSNCTDSQLLAISNVPPYANRKIIENPHTPAVDPSTSLLKEKLYALQRENLYLTKRIQCCICHCNHVNCVFLPCGHALACQSCAKKEIGLHCRLCKQLIQDTLKFYL
nr:adhesion G-protein coupled receptor D1-like [Biomphalaria glabrata]